MDIDLIYKKYEKYSKIIPNDVDNIIQSCYLKLTKIRNDLMLKQRFIIVSPIYKDSTKPNFFPKHKESFFQFITQDSDSLLDVILPQHAQFISKLYDYLLHSPVDLAKVTNSASNLFDDMKFNFFIRSVIPSIFGFYSCQEHISFAYQYFIALISSSSINIVKDVLSTFYQNSCTYRFIEFICFELTQTFFTDTRLLFSDKIDGILDEYSKKIFNSILYSLSLLPPTHLNLLKMMVRFQWKLKDVFTFLLNNCIEPMVQLYIESSPYQSFLKIFLKMFSKVFNHFNDLDLEKSLLKFSLFDIPSAFGDFNQPYVEFLVTPLDASILFDISKKVIQLPKLILMLQNPIFFENPQYFPFWLKVFPKKRLLNSISGDWRNVVFDLNFFKKYSDPTFPPFERRWRMIQMLSIEKNKDPINYLTSSSSFYNLTELSENEGIDLKDFCDNCIKNISENYKMFNLCNKCQNLEIIKLSFTEFSMISAYNEISNKASKFETFLIDQLALQNLKSFSNLTFCLFNISTIYYSTNLIKFQIKNLSLNEFKKIKMNNFLKLPTIFQQIPQNKLFYGLKAKQIFDSIILKKKQIILNQIEKNWISKIITSEMSFFSDYLKHSLISRSKQIILSKYFFQISLNFNILSLIPFQKRFDFMIQSLKEIKKLSEPLNITIKLLNFAVSICNSNEFLTSFLFISSLLMKNKDFISICSDEERSLWFEFEGIILTFLDKDYETLKLYSKLHDELLSFIM